MEPCWSAGGGSAGSSGGRNLARATISADLEALQLAGRGLRDSSTKSTCRGPVGLRRAPRGTRRPGRPWSEETSGARTTRRPACRGRSRRGARPRPTEVTSGCCAQPALDLAGRDRDPPASRHVAGAPHRGVVALGGADVGVDGDQRLALEHLPGDLGAVPVAGARWSSPLTYSWPASPSGTLPPSVSGTRRLAGTTTPRWAGVDDGPAGR